MKKKRNSKRMPFDEFYSNGFLELGRIGNVVSLKNNFTEADVLERNKELAQQYDEKKAEIDTLIMDIREHISKCEPLSLLMAATERGMFNMLNTVSEIQIEGKQNFELRTVEYIQSILVSQESYFEEIHSNQEELIEKVLEEVDELYMKTQIFYIFWAAKTTIDDKDLNEKDIQYIMEAQLMGNVRGKRYQFQQLTNLKTLLLPHSEKMEELYGVSAQDLLDGLEKLEYSLSSAKLDSWKGMFNEFLKFQKASEGKSSEDIEKLFDEIRESQQNLELSKKCFGTDLYDIEKVTGWDGRLVNSLSWNIGECREFIDNKDFSGWIIRDLPVQKKPFIKINGVSYCFDYYNLFDNIYRIIQKDMKGHDSKYTTQWADIQKEASENLVEEQFKRLLPGCQSYVGNYYPIGNSLKQMDESDIMILYDDTLIIAEVKAGSFTYTPAITDYKAHKSSFDALIGKADYQCERTLNYINKAEKITFYDDKKNEKVTFNRKKYKNVFTFCVTVDNFNAFEAKIEKMNFLQVNSGTIAISVDDLEVYTAYFDSPLYFLHYLKQRKAATRSKTLLLSDELDHLGMYIVHNNYEMYTGEFEDCDSFAAYGYRENLDAYFASLHCKEVEYEKPLQEVPDEIKKIISVIEERKLQERVSFTNFLLDFDSVTRNELAESILYLLRRQKELGRMLPAFRNGEVMHGWFVKQNGIKEISEKDRLSYMYANMLRIGQNESWYIILQYNELNKLEDVYYKKLYIEDIDNEAYDKNELNKLADIVYRNRVAEILKNQNKKKIYPNDFCPCGSGKKYKKCCGKA